MSSPSAGSRRGGKAASIGAIAATVALAAWAPGAAAKPVRAPAAAEPAAADDAARCASLSTEVRKHIANVKLLELRLKAERAAPPTSLVRSWERMTGKPEADQQQTVEQLKLEREKVQLLGTGLVANSCPPVDPATVKEPEASALPPHLR
jgi:hypothetical protein